MLREASLGVREVHIGGMLRAAPQEHLSVSGEEVKGRGHSDRLEVVEWCGVLSGYIVVSSRLRVLAAHDQTRWGVGLEDVGGEHERPDARWGAVWRAAPGEGGFCKRWLILSVRSIGVGTCPVFKVGGAIAVGETKFKSLRAAPCCVYRLVSLRIH
jgi:hypothetical protein